MAGFDFQEMERIELAMSVLEDALELSHDNGVECDFDDTCDKPLAHSSLSISHEAARCILGCMKLGRDGTYGTAPEAKQLAFTSRILVLEVADGDPVCSIPEDLFRKMVQWGVENGFDSE